MAPQLRGSDQAPPDFPIIKVSGTRHEIGYLHGVQQRQKIEEFLGDSLCRIGPMLGISVDLHALSPVIRCYQECIDRNLPSIANELVGFAEGAQISIEQAYLLQLRRELVGYQKLNLSGDCSTIAKHGRDAVTMAQTIDLNGNMTDELAVLAITMQETGRSLLMVSFTGLLGYLGLNDKGLSICINLVLAGTWGPGIPGYMLIRHLLDEAESVTDCIEILKSLPRASSRSLTIFDGKELVCIEYTPTEVAVRHAKHIAHTNHFLEQILLAKDELNPFARTSSEKRLERCERQVGLLDAGSPAENYFQALSGHPVFVADNGSVRRECTVATVVMHPLAGKLYVKKATSLHPHLFSFA